MQQFPHGYKLDGRFKKYPSERLLLSQMQTQYVIWKTNCLKVDVTNENDLRQIIYHTNNYVNFITHKRFNIIQKNSQNKIYPAVLEETMYYLFRSIVKPPLVCGTHSTPIGLYLKSYNEINYEAYYEDNLDFENIDADFVIGIEMISKITKNSEIIPFVIIENKRYPDKTMRGIGENITRKLKVFSTDCFYIFAVDLLRKFISKEFNSKLSNLSQIYGLREWNNDSNYNLREDVVFKLFSDVVFHLDKIKKESVTIEERFNRGFMMDRYTPPLSEVFQIVEEIQRIKPINEQPVIIFNKENTV